jgi:hypothetical protein
LVRISGRVVLDFFFNDFGFKSLGLEDINISRPRFESEVPEFLGGLFLTRDGFKRRVFEWRELDFSWFI